MRSAPLVALAFALATVAASAATPAAIVRVTGGDVEGQVSTDGGAVFKGIPFAAPPVGKLRWQEPQPVKAWTGVKKAADYGHACMQAVAGWNKTATDDMSEDCLYLNVWNSEWPAKAKKPVMLWIHGGGNSGGSARGAGGVEPPFDAASLAKHGVVVVSINYRLGVFGFVGHPEATADSAHHAAGGYGTQDQVAALRWVHDNIAKFGGDPANVTIFGQSAGAQDVTILVASPLTKGLIHKAIAQSGSPMIGDRKLLTPKQTEQLGVILATTLKAPATGQLAYLRALPADQIIAALPDFRKAMAEAKLNLDVNIDGYSVPEWTPRVFAEGRQAHVPLIIGNNGKDSPGFRPSATPEAAQEAITTRINGIYGAYPDLLQKAKAAYAAGSENASHGSVEYQATVDYSFRCTDAVVARWQSTVAPTYHYEFTAGNAAHPPIHSAELDYVFGYMRDQAQDPTLSTLSAQMQQYWTNFAKTGNPNGAGLPEWPRFDGAARKYLELSSTGPQTKADLRGAVCPLYYEKLSRDLAAK
jgi:para-nitrobenzyl esterase